MRFFLAITACLTVGLAGCNGGTLVGSGGADGPDSEADVPETPESVDPEPGVDCTLTQGYWKNHEDAWPTDALDIGGQSYTDTELLDLLWTETRGDASMILGHQLIAALLNVEQGAVASPEVWQALSDAQDWMADNVDGDDGRLAYEVYGGPTFEPATELSTILDEFNRGLLSSPHCDDTDAGDDDTTDDTGQTDDL